MARPQRRGHGEGDAARGKVDFGIDMRVIGTPSREIRRRGSARTRHGASLPDLQTVISRYSRRRNLLCLFYIET